MAKKIEGFIKLQIPAGAANPAIQADGEAALTLLRWADRELR